jgi:hypothetical protein
MKQQPGDDEDEGFDEDVTNEPTPFFTGAMGPLVFGLTSLAMTLVTTLWFIMCFTAQKPAWWNSDYWFPLYYFIAAVVALRGIRSPVGIVALVVALVPFISLSYWLFVVKVAHGG